MTNRVLIIAMLQDPRIHRPLTISRVNVTAAISLFVVIADIPPLPSGWTMQVWIWVSESTALLASGKGLAFDGHQDVVDAEVPKFAHDPHSELGALGLLEPDAEHAFCDCSR